MKPTKFELFLNQFSKDIAIGRVDVSVLEDMFVKGGLWDKDKEICNDYKVECIR